MCWYIWDLLDTNRSKFHSFPNFILVSFPNNQRMLLRMHALRPWIVVWLSVPFSCSIFMTCTVHMRIPALAIYTCTWDEYPQHRDGGTGRVGRVLTRPNFGPTSPLAVQDSLSRTDFPPRVYWKVPRSVKLVERNKTISIMTRLVVRNFKCIIYLMWVEHTCINH